MKRLVTTLSLFIAIGCCFAQTSSNSYTNSYSSNSNSGKSGKGTVTFDCLFDYFTNTSSTTFGMNYGFGYRYYLHNNFFAEGLIGYRWTIASSSSPNFTALEHDITLPIHVGGYIPVSKKIGIGALVGPRIEFPVAYKYEVNNKKISTDKPDVHTALELGLDFRFSDWGIRLIYGIGLGSKNKANYVGLGVSAGF